MDDDDSLARLQGLQADLIAFSEARLPNLERLWVELEASIDGFRTLLERQRRSDKSRKELAGEKIKIKEEEYGINDDFRQEVIQVSDALDLDELEAAHLCIHAQSAAGELERPVALAAILQFHGHREALLNVLRLSVQQAVELDLESDQRDVFAQFTRMVVQSSETGPSSGSAYVRKCFAQLEDIESWLRRIQDRLQGASIIGQDLNSFAMEVLEFQRGSLIRQHESLSVISCFLVKEGYATVDDYRLLLGNLAKLDTYDNQVVHYVPLLVSCAASLGPVDGAATLRDVRSLDQTFADKSDRTRWKLTDFRAAASAVWLAEYSGRYTDNPTGSPLQGVNIEKENDSRSDRFMESLRDGAFEFILVTCSRVRVETWHDPAKAGLVRFLLGDTMNNRDAQLNTSDYFQDLLAEQLQTFIDALITNMPDTIRRLKFEEDEERRNMGMSRPHAQPEHTLHLERFLVIISYAFQGFPDAALEAFWSDPDGNMYGFLQWASKRQSTPRVAAFCEMLQAIAGSGECADAAHKFLLDEAVGASSARLRKGSSLSWTQVFAELQYYANRIQDTPGVLFAQGDNGLASQTSEPESALMLECYLRLAAHMCRTSSAAREFILSHQEFGLHEVLFDLGRSAIDSRFKACAFTTLASMLTEKTSIVTSAMWEALDNWINGVSNKPGVPKPVTNQNTNDREASTRLGSIAVGFEEPNAFVRFLHALVIPVASSDQLDDALPFPEQLGLAYRMPGIDHYIDFVFERVLKGVLPDLADIDQIWELRCTCLSFIAACLSRFNEDLVVFANTTSINVDAAITTSSLAAYARLHPFARVMEWLFNDGVIYQLFASTHENVDVIGASAPGSPRVLALCQSIHIIDTVLRLQATYFDIVRPIIKTQSTTRSKQVANPALASFEDAILVNLRVVPDLGLYCGTAHQDLTICSINLLQRLGTSRKLARSVPSMPGGYASASRLVTALQQDNDVDRITAAFIAPVQLDQREVEMGELAPGLSMKQAILDLINSSLEVSPDRPGLAHCLLGFSCSDQTITVHPEGRFARGASLFHAIARLLAENLVSDEAYGAAWMASLRHSASEVIRRLIRSSLTSTMILSELRGSGFNDTIALAQMPITTNSKWCGRTCDDTEFLTTESSATFLHFMLERAAFFEHASLELRSASIMSAPSIRQQTKSSLLGTTTLSSGEQVQNPSVFDLFDFIDLNLAQPFGVPSLSYMAGLDFSICKKDVAGVGLSYDLRLVRELLTLRISELQKSGRLVDPSIAQQCQEEADMVVYCLQSQNQYASIHTAQQSALKAWAQVIVILLHDGEFEPAQKSAFILQALQIVLPKMDTSLVQESPITLPLVKLVYALVQAQNPDLHSKSKREANFAWERLMHAFRTCLGGITAANDNIGVRETCYQVARHFLKTMAGQRQSQGTMGRQASKLVESAGERLVDAICEDALSSQGTCKIAALLMLEASVQLFQAVKSSHMVRSMTRLNFVAVLVDSIRAIASDLQDDRAPEDLKMLLASVHTSLALLLRLSQDSEGATAVLDAGMFSAVRDSQLFATDPDIGLDVENPEALQNFYELLISILRVLNSIILVKGPRNNQIMAMGRNFLLENRLCVQTLFKATTRSDKASVKTKQTLDDLVDNFAVLINATDFLGYDEQPVSRRTTGHTFT